MTPLIGRKKLLSMVEFDDDDGDVQHLGVAQRVMELKLRDDELLLVLIPRKANPSKRRPVRTNILDVASHVPVGVGELMESELQEGTLGYLGEIFLRSNGERKNESYDHYWGSRDLQYRRANFRFGDLARNICIDIGLAFEDDRDANFVALDVTYVIPIATYDLAHTSYLSHIHFTPYLEKGKGEVWVLHRRIGMAAKWRELHPNYDICFTRRSHKGSCRFDTSLHTTTVAPCVISVTHQSVSRKTPNTFSMVDLLCVELDRGRSKCREVQYPRESVRAPRRG
ncbi:hypothetical protein BJY52DRAFT_1419253 [Lactarius psammicola]|nr:hypothetical protein BJY52DRAFT_1419253 [Lactarius psammicola]